MIAFKIMSFEHVGSITFCRIYSGKLEQGMALANTTREKKERVGRMYLMHAADREEIKEAFAGDIVALQASRTPHRRDAVRSAEAGYPREDGLPNPVIEMKIEPKTKAVPGEDGDGAVDLGARGPLVPRLVDQEFGQTILKGMGELHLDIKVDILETHAWRRGQYRRAASRLPRDARAPREIDYTHKKQTGGTGQFARQAAARPSRTRRARATSSNRDRRRHGAQGVHSRRREGRQLGVDNGVLIGFPMVDMKVTLFDGAYHEVDSVGDRLRDRRRARR